MYKLLIISFLLATQHVYAQSVPEPHSRTEQVSVKDVVASQLVLEPEEEAVFWPLFHRYFQEMQTRLNNRLLFWEKMQHITPLISAQDMHRHYRSYLSAQQQEWDSKHFYYRQMKQHLPPDKVLRFFQIMEKCQAMIESQLLTSVPLIEPRHIVDTTGVDTPTTDFRFYPPLSHQSVPE